MLVPDTRRRSQTRQDTVAKQVDVLPGVLSDVPPDVLTKCPPSQYRKHPLRRRRRSWVLLRIEAPSCKQPHPPNQLVGRNHLLIA